MFQVELEFGNVGFCGGRKTKATGEKPAGENQHATNSTVQPAQLFSYVSLHALGIILDNNYYSFVLCRYLCGVDWCICSRYSQLDKKLLLLYNDSQFN